VERKSCGGEGSEKETEGEERGKGWSFGDGETGGGEGKERLLMAKMLSEMMDEWLEIV
jgi:hypothetical protein